MEQPMLALQQCVLVPQGQQMRGLGAPAAESLMKTHEFPLIRLLFFFDREKAIYHSKNIRDIDGENNDLDAHDEGDGDDEGDEDDDGELGLQDDIIRGLDFLYIVLSSKNLSFDFSWILAQQWQKIYCSFQPKYKKCNVPIPIKFIIHELWPYNISTRSQPENCATNVPNILPLKDRIIEKDQGLPPTLLESSEDQATNTRQGCPNKKSTFLPPIRLSKSAEGMDTKRPPGAAHSRTSSTSKDWLVSNLLISSIGLTNGYLDDLDVFPYEGNDAYGSLLQGDFVFLLEVKHPVWACAKTFHTTVKHPVWADGHDGMGGAPAQPRRRKEPAKSHGNNASVPPQPKDPATEQSQDTLELHCKHINTFVKMKEIIALIDVISGLS
ncbi:hypothetical protein Fmac_029128 [Flemingia macrophylla]|uniref:Uncharacterized protein n=1 Tax=Flemingia macrophylla TaxID=520843 RepID=A0ABD1L9H1_9FABA